MPRFTDAQLGCDDCINHAVRREGLSWDPYGSWSWASPFLAFRPSNTLRSLGALAIFFSTPVESRALIGLL